MDSFFFRDDRNFIPESPTIIEEIEEFPPREEADRTEEPLWEEDGNDIFIGKVAEDEEWFKCFIDGTYRIARIGSYGGVPLYVASIVAVMTERIKEKKLTEIGLRKNLTVVLFPFDVFSDVFSDSRGEKVQRFKQYLAEKYHAFPDFEFSGDALNILQKDQRSNLWIYSDISYLGMRYNDPAFQKRDINEESLLDEGKIYSRVKSRVRVLMTMLEVANLKYLREVIEEGKYKSRDEKWVLVDGTLSNYIKFFCAETNQSEYYSILNKTVGFIKTIRRNPQIDIKKIFALREGEFIVSIANKTDEEIAVREEMQEDNLIGENQWGFIYLRFRKPFWVSSPFFSPRGIIKLQFRATEEYNSYEYERIKLKAIKIASLIMKERFPLPSDRFRIWKESVVIEETEKIARARLLSEEWLRNRGCSL